MILEWTDIDGHKILKNNPLKITVNSSTNMYCYTMTVIYPYENDFRDYCEVKFIFDEKTVFRGMVDSQRFIRSRQKQYLLITCRTLAGYLTDNFLQPQNLRNITDSVIYHTYLEPFGISCHTLANKPYNGMLNIGKNVSIFDMAQRYCKEVFHTDFTVNCEGIAFFDGNSNTTEFVFTDGRTNLNENTYSYYDMDLTYQRKNVIAQIKVKNTVNANAYTVTLHNPYAENRKIQCIRYLDATPSGENTVHDGETMIENANRQSFCAVLKIPCFVCNPLHAAARLYYGGNLFDNLEVTGTDYLFEHGKSYTTITLGRGGKKLYDTKYR